MVRQGRVGIILKLAYFNFTGEISKTWRLKILTVNFYRHFLSCPFQLCTSILINEIVFLTYESAQFHYEEIDKLN